MHGGVGMSRNWVGYGEIDAPEVVGGNGAVSLEEKVVVEVDVDAAGSECGGAPGVAELADGDKGCVTKGGEEVG